MWCVWVQVLGYRLETMSPEAQQGTAQSKGLPRARWNRDDLSDLLEQKEAGKQG